jgi:hypothetical protein
MNIIKKEIDFNHSNDNQLIVIKDFSESVEKNILIKEIDDYKNKNTLIDKNVAKKYNNIEYISIFAIENRIKNDN